MNIHKCYFKIMYADRQRTRIAFVCIQQPSIRDELVKRHVKSVLRSRLSRDVSVEKLSKRYSSFPLPIYLQSFKGICDRDRCGQFGQRCNLYCNRIISFRCFAISSSSVGARVQPKFVRKPDQLRVSTCVILHQSFDVTGSPCRHKSGKLSKLIYSFEIFALFFVSTLHSQDFLL